MLQSSITCGRYTAVQLADAFEFLTEIDFKIKNRATSNRVIDRLFNSKITINLGDPMKLIYTDNHFCQYSSILRKRGAKYSVRLENQIKSINWVQQLAVEQGCNAIYCLGDFFDQSALNAEELTALKDINWSATPNTFLVGNHELGNADATFTSAHLLKLIPSCLIINQPALFDCGEMQIYFVYLI